MSSDDFMGQFLYLTGREPYLSEANYGGDGVSSLAGKAKTYFSFPEMPYMATARMRLFENLLAEGRNPQRRLSEVDFLSSDLIHESSSGLSSPAQPGSRSSSL